MFRIQQHLLSALTCALLLLSNTIFAAVNYDIVYVKQPRNGDDAHIVWPEVFHPGRLEPNSDLILLHPDGSEEVLVDTEFGAVTDPFVSFDGEWVYYSLFHDLRRENLNTQRGDLPKQGSDIYRIHIPTRKVERLTHQEFTPNTGTGDWDESNPVNPDRSKNRLGYGILNTGPAPLAGGKIMFTSNRNGFRPTKNYTFPTMQLFVMDEDGKNVTPIAPMSIGSALHPTPLADGRVLFSTYESQGLRDRRLWGIWSIWPDGRKWEPVISAFRFAKAFHFMTQLSDQSLVVEDYYNLNNFGFGALYRIPQATSATGPRFHSANASENPKIRTENAYGYFQMPFTPKGMYSVTPLSSSADDAATDGYGKYTHPSAAPGNDLLVAWSDGPVNRLKRPTPWPAVDSGIYIIHDGDPVNDITQLELIKNDSQYNEVWPRAVVPYKSIYGIDEPAKLPWLPNDGSQHAQLPEGTPYGLIGTSSFYNRETTPGAADAEKPFSGLDVFNTSQNNQSSNWNTQGSDAGQYSNSDIWAVRILSMEPNPDRGYGPHSSPQGGIFFKNHANERLRILGEIPLRKFGSNGEPILDPQGNPDTSFLAKIPADTPFTFQTIDRNGMVLNMAQTWHQVRPGEVRNDCGGCHAHSQEPVKFSDTAAAKPDYEIWDLTQSTPLITQSGNGEPDVIKVPETVANIEFYQDIRPVLQEKCTSCHSASNTPIPAQLVLDDISETDGLPGDYKRLCSDKDAEYGIPPLVTVGSKPKWRQTNASRYVRQFQSRRSLLMWKLFGERLDGWRNEDHPSASVPGDRSTLPEGTRVNDSDLDFIGSVMPIPGHGVEPLSIDEKMNFARWIDLGCPIDLSLNSSHEGYGWFSDDLRPTLTIAAPRAGVNPVPPSAIKIGIADAFSGINRASLRVTADFEVNGLAAGTDLSAEFSDLGGNVLSLPLTTSLTAGMPGTVYVEVADMQGNITREARSFSIAIDDSNPPNDDNPPDDDTPDDNASGGNNDGNTTSYLTISDTTLFSYSSSQDNNGTVALSDDGLAITLQGNLWKQIEYPLTITENTVLEFQFRSLHEGEIHGIGVDYARDEINSSYNFQLFGTQRWGLQNYHRSPPLGDWVAFEIPIGKYFTGEFKGINLINDHDVNTPEANSQFKNIRLFEVKPEPPVTNLEVAIEPTKLHSYDGNQDSNGTADISDDGRTLELSGNTWKQLTAAIRVEPETVLVFEFRAGAQGDIHGIGLDVQQQEISSQYNFQLYGTQRWGIQDFHEYNGADWRQFIIPIGEYFTGDFTGINFINDHDIAIPTAQSAFRNVRVLTAEKE
ncbi:hypothetical protein OLMES_2021 [Oleiphilus messinensis]|uniref:Hydrazine synthase alpha subunit middle domain-containing protein n=1 Tax=Oleiphilus messinensis TaxID=141451 RepID=A0A1Y0I9J1_9GAMM|nr:hypothetical protein [Oleiphilus messinensis]ARU56094.1 hypothetical protein OLMES_2021 [Oleiphilus messinensis]